MVQSRAASVAEVTVLGGRRSTLAGFNFPGTVFSSLIFGPTLRLSEAPPIPSPAASMLGLAGFGLLALRRNRR